MIKEKANKAKLALYKLEFKLQKRSTIWWLAILSILLIVDIVIYPLIDSMLGVIPQDEMQELENAGLSFDFSGVTQYYLIECVQMLALGGALFLCCFAINSLMRDFKGKQNELLFTNSLSRSDIVLTKYFASLTMTVIFNILAFILSVISMMIVDIKGIEIVPMLSLTLSCLLVHLVLVTLTFALFMFRPKKSGYGLALAVPLLLYFVAIIGMSLTGENGLGFVEYLSPFTPAFDITIEKPFDINAWPLLIFAVLDIVLAYFALKKFKKQDF